PPHAIESLRFFSTVKYRRMSARLHALTEYHTSYYVVTLKETGVAAQRFWRENLVETTNRDGRTFVRRNYWLMWEELLADKRIAAVAADILQTLQQQGIRDVNAAHSISREVDPQHRPTGPGSPLQDNEKVAAMLLNLDGIALSECSVVGKYLRHDPRIRNTLKDWVRRIKHPLLAKTTSRENFLVWAAPGSGKTYLIQQIAERLKVELNGAVDYVECNLANDDPDNFIRKVNSLSSKTQ